MSQSGNRLSTYSNVLKALSIAFVSQHLLHCVKISVVVFCRLESNTSRDGGN